ncbi:hypothetical protein [Dyella nitratireducens]|uniref:Uncharacterized protein n=1 Tax=Dyella nitratireducens TaxID=1849580 RepID=A0ABQ1G7P1_9GAMM|nr:hypothetical protein [Dyella nitratireducens]GGA38377.1 hypothetical protein GCM10010981_29460 [Dyella nitratireducens]GLQ40303.1 hypothetical protein GCM10007902_01520 [Dyella nitratireducens]
MPNRIKPTMTVYPCHSRSQPVGSSDTPKVWVTWEAIEREHFNPNGSLVADFSHPIEVDPSLVKDHRYMPDEVT